MKYPNVWFSSDPHFYHKNILTFKDHNDNLTRPFSSIEEMNELIIENHNAVVKPGDKFYSLGDLGFNKNGLADVLPRLNGKKRLILGNHDQYKMSFYEQYFEKIMISWRPMRKLMFTHIPIYIGGEGIRVNVHGHVHQNTLDDERYINISMENTDYKPLHFEDIIAIVKTRGIELE